MTEDGRTDSCTILKGSNGSKNELPMTENTTNQPIDGHEMVPLTQDEGSSQTLSENAKNANDVNEESQRISSLEVELMGNPDMINPNKNIKDQLKVLPYNTKREIPRAAFEPTDLLGSGNFGTVYKGVLKGLYGPESKTEIAIKTTNSSVGDTAIKDFLDEIKIMGYVKPHINLVSMIGSCTSDLNKDKESWLLLELCHFEDLHNSLFLFH